MTTKQTRPLQRMFSEVPPKYDIINRLFTFRLDENWRKRASMVCMSYKPEKILDLCTGTGDMALRLGKMADGNTEVTGLDFSETMLIKAREKREEMNLSKVTFVNGDAAALPFDDNYFDVVGISFALRNLTFRNPDTEKFLAEILRVLKPGGTFVAVESSQPKSKIFRTVFHMYMKYFVTWLGAIISGNKGAYQYFTFSVRNFYSADDLVKLFTGQGFATAEYIPLFGGVSAIHIARKADK